MARAPRAKVPKTSGQGISRLAYQQAYAMKGGLTERFSAGKQKSPSTGNTRSYPKEKGGKFNIAFAGMFDPQEKLK
jgi:hypothetical protein